MTIALGGVGRLTAPERRGLVALLLRAGLIDSIVPKDRADVVLAFGAVEPCDRPVVVFPPLQRTTSTAALAGLLKNPLQRLPAMARTVTGLIARQVELTINLPLLFADMLSPLVEAGTELDAHGRVAPKANTLYRLGVLEKPVLDELARAFLALVCELAGRPVPPPKQWRFCATFDIDSDGLLRPRRLARTALDLARRRPRRLGALLQDVLWSIPGVRVDPHLRLREVAEQLEAQGVPASFLVQARRRHKLDSYGLRRKSPLVRELELMMASEFHEVGLHSSYRTMEMPAAGFLRQWRHLERTVGFPVTPVHRAHYLRTREARYVWRGESPLVDSSLGFGEAPGFRHGTCFPFPVAPGVVEQPPIAMDSTYIYHWRETPRKAAAHALSLMEQCRAVGGTFVLIMHPHHFHETVSPGWKAFLLDLIDDARAAGALFQSLAHATLEAYEPAMALEEKIAAESAS